MRNRLGYLLYKVKDVAAKDKISTGGNGIRYNLQKMLLKNFKDIRAVQFPGNQIQIICNYRWLQFIVQM